MFGLYLFFSDSKHMLKHSSVVFICANIVAGRSEWPFRYDKRIPVLRKLTTTLIITALQEGFRENIPESLMQCVKTVAHPHVQFR